MESIEERALKKFPIDLDFSNPFCQDETSPKEDYNKEKRDLYIQGAADQKKADIEKAWEYVKGMIEYASNGGDITSISKEVVRKAME